MRAGREAVAVGRLGEHVSDLGKVRGRVPAVRRRRF